MGSNITVTVTVVVYLFFILWIGWYSSTKIPTNIDFMVAGRCLGLLLMANTLAATEVGNGSSLGMVQNGMSGFGLSASWYIITMGIAFVILSFVAPKFRTAVVRAVSEYFHRRYGKPYGTITAIIMFLPPVGLAVEQFTASVVILSTMLSIDYRMVVIIVAVVVMVYSIMGGLRNVALTDSVQVFLIVIGMIIAVPFAMSYAGGWGNVASSISKGTLSLPQSYDLLGVISLVIMYIAIFFVGQEAVSRPYAIRDEKAAEGDVQLATLVNFIYVFVPTILGIITLALVNVGKFSSAWFESVNTRYVLPVPAINTMPALICGLLFAGIISAIMSSSDSNLLGAGSIFTNDIYKAVLKLDASSQSVMKVMKIVTCLVGLASMLTALFSTQSIVSILMLCFTLRAAGPFFLYVMGHYWRKASTADTIASLIAGAIVVVCLGHVSKGMLFGIKFNQPIIPGLAVAFICFTIFSLAMSPEKEIAELTPEEDDQIRIQQEFNGDLNGI